MGDRLGIPGAVDFCLFWLSLFQTPLAQPSPPHALHLFTPSVPCPLICTLVLPVWNWLLHFLCIMIACNEMLMQLLHRVGSRLAARHLNNDPVLFTAGTREISREVGVALYLELATYHRQ